MKNLITEIISLFSDFVNRVLFVEKKSIFFYQNVKLYPSEIHLILYIHQHGFTNATRMAEGLSVTKGAVSQIISRLEKKDVIKKYKDPFAKNELTIEFTKKGKKVLKHYIEFSKNIEKKYTAYLETLSENEKNTIRNFFSYALSVMDEVANHHK